MGGKPKPTTPYDRRLTPNKDRAPHVPRPKPPPPGKQGAK
jgi:hypothetical protein